MRLRQDAREIGSHHRFNAHFDAWRRWAHGLDRGQRRRADVPLQALVDRAEAVADGRRGHTKLLGALGLPLILDAMVVHVHQRVRHPVDDHVEVIDAESALVELTVFELGEDDALDHGLEGLAVGGVDSARGGFDGVHQHHDCGLARLGAHARIANRALTKLLRISTLQALRPEVLHELRAVVGVSEFGHRLRHPALAQDLRPEHHVSHDRVGAHVGVELVVG